MGLHCECHKEEPGYMTLYFVVCETPSGFTQCRKGSERHRARGDRLVTVDPPGFRLNLSPVYNAQYHTANFETSTFGAAGSAQIRASLKRRDLLSHSTHATFNVIDAHCHSTRPSVNAGCMAKVVQCPGIEKPNNSHRIACFRA